MKSPYLSHVIEEFLEKKMWQYTNFKIQRFKNHYNDKFMFKIKGDLTSQYENYQPARQVAKLRIKI